MSLTNYRAAPPRVNDEIVRAEIWLKTARWLSLLATFEARPEYSDIVVTGLRFRVTLRSFKWSVGTHRCGVKSHIGSEG